MIILKAIAAICLILLAITHCSNSQWPTIVDPVLPVATVTSDVIREFFVARNVSFDFVIYGESSNHINDVIDRVRQLMQDTPTPITVKHLVDVERWDHKMNQSAVIFTRRAETLRKLHKTAEESSASVQYSHLTNPAAKAFKFLVYTEEIESHEKLLEVTGQYNNAWIGRASDLRHFELFITSNATHVNLTANDLVLSDKVINGTIAPRFLNSFDKQSQQWSEKLTNYEHYSDLRGCLMPFHVEASYSMYIDQQRELWPGDESFKRLLISGNPKFAGALNEVLETMAEKANFVPHITFITTVDGIAIYPTRNYDVGFSAVIMSTAFFGQVTHNGIHLSLPFASTDGYYLVGPNDMYTNYEKLLFPFDAITWFLLLFTMGFTFGTIFGLYRFPQWVRTIVFGKGVKSPAYNALGIFFGVSQVQEPREAFSRWILLMFLCFCLIFRTAYQSMMFEFMTSDMRWPLPESVDDLRTMNYDIAVMLFDDTPDEISSFERINNELINGRLSPNIQRHNFATISSLYKRALDGEPGIKIAFLATTDMHIVLNSTFKRSLPIMRNEKLTQTHAVVLVRNHFLLQHLNHVVDRLIPSGILQHQFKYAFWILHRPGDDELVDPRRILSLTDLEFGFVLWLVACLVSFVCFICELSIVGYKKLKVWLRRLASFVSFLRILLAFLDGFHGGW